MIHLSNVRLCGGDLHVNDGHNGSFDWIFSALVVSSRQQTNKYCLLVPVEKN